MTNISNHSLQAFKLGCIRQHKLLFSDLSFCVQAGSALVVTGPNGAGKSSLLRLLAGLSMPALGELWWQGKRVSADYQAQLHYIGHTNGIKLGLSVLENLQLMNALSDQPTVDLELCLSLLQLDQQRQVLAGNLSAGQKRRIALAKLWLVPKRLWILDEPLTAIDAETQAVFSSHLAAHLKNDGVAVVSSHQSLPLQDLQTLELLPC